MTSPLRESPLLLDDLPLEAGLRPALDQLADRLANLVRSAPLTSPILVSGDWGAGKTTLLRAVCRKLADAALTNAGTPTVMFEAWQHESANALLPALMRRVWEATPATFQAKKASKALLWDVLRWAASAAGRIGAPVLGAALGLPAPFADGIDVAKAAKRAAKTLDELKPPADPIEELRNAFARLVQSAWPDRTPVVFIDDLDRCNPADTVALLDAVRSFAACADRLRVRFVAALDRSVVTQAISAKFANVRGYDGNRYLEKIFPLEFHVPSPQHAEIKDIIKAMAAPLEQGERQRAEFALTEALSPACFANTRLIKRCFNRYCLLRYFELGQGTTTDVDKLSLQWIAAIERWPRLRTLQQRRQRDFWTAVSRKQLDDPDLQALMTEPGFVQWLDTHGWPRSSDALDRFDHADARLRQFGM
jgi:Cdc6-like AAA superfamily ATPase